MGKALPENMCFFEKFLIQIKKKKKLEAAFQHPEHLEKK